MKRYFPFLRGKQNELMALRDLSNQITHAGCVIPIIEPVNTNGTTKISIDVFEESSMPFLFITNPAHGDCAQNPEELFTELISEGMLESDTWTPALLVNNGTQAIEVTTFLNRYNEYEVAVIYYGLPGNQQTQQSLNNGQIIHHVFIENRVPQAYVNNVPIDRRVYVGDRFHRQNRNVDYPPTEFFTDQNTLAGNPQGFDFGDFSMVGDGFAGGGPAYAVAIHHIHYQSGANGPLAISHFLSDNNETVLDPNGKVLEAIDHLVPALANLHPNTTTACDEYREMEQTRIARGLGYLKRLAMKHHIEVMLGGGIQL